MTLLNLPQLGVKIFVAAEKPVKQFPDRGPTVLILVVGKKLAGSSAGADVSLPLLHKANYVTVFVFQSVSELSASSDTIAEMISQNCVDAFSVYLRVIGCYIAEPGDAGLQCRRVA